MPQFGSLNSICTGEVIFKGKPVHIHLMDSAIYYQNSRGVMVGNIDMLSVIGSAIVKDPTHDQNWKLIIYRYSLSEPFLCNSCIGGNKLRQASHVEFVVPDYSIGQTWMNIINTLTTRPYFELESLNLDIAHIEPPRKRKFLVVINPKAGQGLCLHFWHNTVKVMLKQANIDVKLFVTEGPNHAYLYVLSFDWMSYDAIVTMGGDGTMSEVVNGICNRDDGEQALSKLVLIPLGGGTGNGLVKSILFSCNEEYSITNALFAAVRGEPQSFDLAFVQTQSKKHHSFLMNSWGLISDIDILSESMRWMGETRLYMAAVYFIMNKRMYSGRLSYLPTSAVSEPPSVLPPLGSPLPSSWDVIDGDFISVFIAQTSHCSTSAHSSPGSQLADSVFSIQIVRSVSRWQLLQLLIAFDTGEHINHPCVFSYKAFAYRLEPFTSGGRFSLDGELVEYGPIQAVIMKNKATTFKFDKPYRRV